MSTNYEASVVIGFRDWGAARIRRSAQSVLASFDGISAQCIISDYGSADPSPARRVADELSTGYVYTADDPVWSRSRALNAGFAIATGKIFISTDADMLFSPKSMRRIVETAQEAEECALFLQCRDLPTDMGDEYFASLVGVDWNHLERMSRLRPRWGMGGMMAIPAAGFSAIRGFDERLHTYGGEDLDFAHRAQRAGYRTVWVDETDVRMYHMWHPPTIKNVEQTEAGRQAVAFNREVVYNDKTYIRNTANWRFQPSGATPLISFAIATRDRPALLEQTIRSILTQTVKDFEVIIVDDGSSDESIAHVIESFRDQRLRYFRQDALGISAARNLALDVCCGQFTAVMDDDDLIPSHRLEWQLEAISDGYVGSVGSFVNFDDETGETQLIVSQIPSIAQAVAKGGAPGHGTWLIRSDVMRTVRYDETITSGVDNNFFLRMLRTGYKIAHCGKPVLLRRRHKLQVTSTDTANQADAAKQALQFLRFRLQEDQLTDLAHEATAQQYPQASTMEEMVNSVRAYLPDKLISRVATVHLADDVHVPTEFDGDSLLRVLSRDGKQLKANLEVHNASYRDLVALSEAGTQMEVWPDDIPQTNPGNEIPWVLEALNDYLERVSEGAVIEVAIPSQADNEKLPNETVYEMTHGASTETITLRTSDQVNYSTSRLRPWLHIGLTAEEYWK